MTLPSRAVVYGAAACIALIGLLPQFLSRTLPDTAFLLHAAGRVLDGARLYVDLIEINPPLVVWLDLPVVALARTLGTSEILLYRLAVVALLVGSVVACRAVLRRTADGRDPAFGRALLLLVVFALFVLPRLDWGEREHLLLALALPYLLLAVVRLEGAPVGRRLAFGTGVAAAVGIAIKPHFVLLWFAREGVLMVSARRWRVSPEGGVIVAVGAVYLAAVMLVTPEYFALVGELGGAYQRFIRNPLLVTALLGDGAAVTLGALLVAAGLWRHAASPSLRVTLVVGAVACYAAAVLQLKGWRYHFYPALALGWILLAVLALRLDRPLERWTERLFAAIAGAGAVTLALATVTACLLQAARPLDPRYDADPSIGQIIPLVREHAAGRDIIVLSPNMASGFPLTMYAGARWPQRFSNLWPLVAEYDGAIHAAAPIAFRESAAMTPLERRLLETVAEDLKRSDAPIMLVLRTGPDQPKWGMRRLDLVEFLSRDARFSRLLTGYHRAGIVGQYDVFYRRGEPGALRLLPPVESVGDAPDSVRIAPETPLLTLVFLSVLAVLYHRSSPPRNQRDA